MCTVSLLPSIKSHKTPAYKMSLNWKRKKIVTFCFLIMSSNKAIATDELIVNKHLLSKAGLKRHLSSRFYNKRFQFEK